MHRIGDNDNPFRFEEWRSLFEPQRAKPHPGPKSCASEKCTAPADNSTAKGPDQAEIQAPLPVKEMVLALDIVTFMTSTYRERLKRIDSSVSELQETRRNLVNKGLIKEVWFGKVLLLAPTAELYAILGMPSPYKRNVWDIHSFLILVAAKLVETNPLVKHVKTEVSLGDSSSTVDLIAYLKDGNRWACEIIHKGITNVSANAAKLQGKGFSQVVFLCTDFNIKQRVWALIRNAGFAPEFQSVIRCTIFSSLLRQRKQMILRDTP